MSQYTVTARPPRLHLVLSCTRRDPEEGPAGRGQVWTPYRMRKGRFRIKKGHVGGDMSVLFKYLKRYRGDDVYDLFRLPELRWIGR